MLTVVKGNTPSEGLSRGRHARGDLKDVTLGSRFQVEGKQDTVPVVMSSQQDTVTSF